MSCVTERRTQGHHAFSGADSSPVPPFYTLDTSILKEFSTKASLNQFKSYQTQKYPTCYGRPKFFQKEHSLASESFLKKLESLVIFLQHLNQELRGIKQVSLPNFKTQKSSVAALKIQKSSCVSNMSLQLINTNKSDIVERESCYICSGESKSIGKYSMENINDYLVVEGEKKLCGVCASVSSRKGFIAPKITSVERRVTSIPQSFICGVYVALTLIANFLAVMSVNKKSKKLKRNIENTAPLAMLSGLFTVVFIFQLLPLTCTAEPLRNPYDILGVKRHATLQDIRKAYKHLVKEW